MSVNKNIVWFEEVQKDDIGLVGGKGANLGEMTNAHLPIPYGFIVTSHAYFEFIKEAGIDKKMRSLLAMVNYDNPNEVDSAGKHIKQLILNSEMPRNTAHLITKYYEDLAVKENKYLNGNNSTLSEGVARVANLYRNPLVAVRSSATAEDLPNASFAGQQETFLNIQGESHLLQKVKECWASLFNARAIFYRHQNKFDHFKVGLAAVVQRMVQSDTSGIAFSIDPVTNDKSKIVIEAIYGLGEYIVGGKVTPDHYEVAKSSFTILKKEHKYQNVKLMKSGKLNKEKKLSKTEGVRQKISDELITSVAILVKDIEKHYYFPQDIEWAIEGNRVYIVQSRPITTLGNKDMKHGVWNMKDEKPILIGSPASPGIGGGPVKIIFSPTENDKIKKGDILVAPQTNPDYVQAMKKAAAIVTEKGGRTSHAAIVSRELGIPAIVGAEDATKILKDNMIISVDGSNGHVFKGNVVGTQKNGTLNMEHKTLVNKHVKTLTKVYVNLAEPEQAEKVAKQDTDGIGLLRAEFMVAQIGIHPRQFIKEKKQELFINRLAKDLLKFTEAFDPRPVVYRATDFRTNEYRNLTGGAEFEPHEENPMLGFRGAARYIADPEVFQMELEAIKKVWKNGSHNLHLMIPFVRVPWELIKIKEFVRRAGLLDLPGFKLWIMVEVPASALNLEAFINIGIDGVSIGTNDLTMMLLGVDRDNEQVADIYDERNPAVVSVLENIVKTCAKHNITCSICGQAPSDYPELVEKLVEFGITSVSVSPDAVERTRQNIAIIEKKLYKK